MKANDLLMSLFLKYLPHNCLQTFQQVEAKVIYVQPYQDAHRLVLHLSVDLVDSITNPCPYEVLSYRNFWL